MKKSKIPKFAISLLTLVLAIVLMRYLRVVYGVGILIFIILVAFQTPSQKVDKTGEINDANLAMIRVIGLNALLYLAGGYLSLLFF